MNVDYLEHQILGCFLKDNSLLQETRLSSHHFDKNNQHHQILFESMQKLSNQNKVIDKVTLISESYEMIEQLGGIDYINGIRTKGDPKHFEDYERQLLEAYKKRSAAEAAEEYLASDEKDTDSLVRKLEVIEEQGVVDEESMQDIWADMLDEPYREEVKDLTGVPTGIKDLDLMTGGFQKTNSIIMGARPSLGKTATMLKMVRGAVAGGAVPIVFSLEMSKKSLMRRMTASEANINLFLAKNPAQLSEVQKRIWFNTVSQMSEFDMEIYDQSMMTIQEMKAKVRKVKKKYPGRDVIVFIDYLTLIANNGNFYSDHAKITDTSARLKAIAKEYDCPVVTLAQLSRGVEQRQDKRPMLSDLRESGSIEQDADLVLMLYRDSYYNKESEDKTLEINIAKHRDGPTGTVNVTYERATGVIKDMVKVHG
jgi:replicative DNA helicase